MHSSVRQATADDLETVTGILTEAANWLEQRGEGMWRGNELTADRLAGQDVLFVPDPDLSPLRLEVLRHYAGQRHIAVEPIVEYTLVHTPYRRAHVRPVLRALEKEKAVQVHRPPRSAGRWSREPPASLPPGTPRRGILRKDSRAWL